MAKKKSRLLEPLPWFPWNPRQWQASRKVQHMTWSARGIYRELMDECWFKRAIPSSLEGISDLLEIDPEELAHALPQFIQCFELLEDGTMFSPHIERVRTDTDSYRLSQAKRRQNKVKDQEAAPKTTDNQGEPGITTDNQGEPGITTDNRGSAEQNRTGQYRTEQVPPTPLKGERKRRTRVQIIETYSEDVRFVANAVLAKGFWHVQDPDGRPIHQDPAQLCSQLDRIFREYPEIEKELLVQAAVNYLAKPRKAFSAPQWFFGTGTSYNPAAWLVEFRMLKHQAARAAQAGGAHDR